MKRKRKRENKKKEKKNIVAAKSVDVVDDTASEEWDTSNESPVYDNKPHLMVRIQSWRFREYSVPLMAIAPKSTTTRSYSTY